MTDQISIDEELDDVEIIVEQQVDTASKGTRRIYLAALGTFAMAGDKVSSLIEGAVGPSFDRLVVRGESLEQNTLSRFTKPAQQSLDVASDAGRQASRLATSTASTVAEETRKQVVLASNSVLEALSKQVEALRSSVDELRKTMPQSLSDAADDAE
ncbi:MAG: hypothetical protein R3C44_07480 [Chloroflexota bacterium]